MYAGAKGTLYSAILPGQDDEAVAYHSPAVFRQRRCLVLQPVRLVLQRPLPLGTAANEGGTTKWNYHTVAWRDDSEAYKPLHQWSLGRVVLRPRRHGGQRQPIRVIR